ncbi:MAG: 3-dehydroquinate synthase [Dehalococcoidales bacterium]|nr:MAG: 3-dehydroquinate synthase [Dehalococcoidales bacterium]
MRTVTLKTGNTSYDILVGSGLLSQAGILLKEKGLTAGKAVVVTDSRIRKLHYDTLERNLVNAGFEVLVIEIPEGEDQKSLETAGRMYEKLTGFYAERSTPLLALGGGVIGDLTGFIAATYMRGVPLIQLPTTLLSQGDSSIGGKTAVNHGQVKNKIGAFYHPRLIISDVSTLETLSSRELSNGLSEIIKHGLILDADFFEFLENNIDKIKALDEQLLEKIVARSAAIKAGVVEKDELDLGLRNILNCGHTAGHAVESVSGLKIWHGEAVAIGLMVEARISNEMKIMKNNEVERLENILKNAGLPVRLPDLAPGKLLEAMKHDKKVVQGKVRFALPKRIGEAFITDNVNTSIIEKALVN